MNTPWSVLLFLCLFLSVSAAGAGNALPQITAPTQIKVIPGDMMNVPLTVVDPDGDIPAVLLLTGPEGMELVRWSSEQLLLTWHPGTSDAGEHQVVVLLEDARDRAIAVRQELRVFVVVEKQNLDLDTNNR